MSDDGDTWMQDLLKEGPAAFSLFQFDTNYAVERGAVFEAPRPGIVIDANQQGALDGGSQAVASLPSTSWLQQPCSSDELQPAGHPVIGSTANGGNFGTATYQQPEDLQQVQAYGSSAPQSSYVLPASSLPPGSLVYQPATAVQGGGLQQDLLQQQAALRVPGQQNQQIQSVHAATLPQQPMQGALVPSTATNLGNGGLNPQQSGFYQFLQQQQHLQQQAMPTNSVTGLGLTDGFSMPGLPGFAASPVVPGVAANTTFPSIPDLQRQQQQNQFSFAALPTGLANGAAMHTAKAVQPAGHDTSHIGAGKSTAHAVASCHNHSKAQIQSVDASGAKRQLTKSGDASRRYRERQRNLMGSLEAELAAKLAQLQVLEAENEILKLRATVLEATVSSRENTMQVTREHGPPIYEASSIKQSVSEAAEPQQEEAAARDEYDHCTHGYTETEAAAAAAAAKQVQLGGPALSTVSTGSSSSRGIAAAAAQNHSAAISGPSVSAADIKRKRSSPDLIKEMSDEDILRHWRLFLREFSDELVVVQQHAEAQQMAQAQQQQQLGGGASGTIAVAAPTNSGGFSSLPEQRLQELTSRAKHLLEVASTLNPAAYCQLFGRHLDTGLPAVYDDNHWRHVLMRVGLTECQVRHILACAELYLSGVHKLQQERRMLQQQLQASGPANNMIIETDGNTPMQPIVDALATNLRKEHVLRGMLVRFFWDEVLTAVQAAKCAVHSHPLFPDTHALVCVLCQDRMQARLAQGLPPRFVFPHRHDLAQRDTMMRHAVQQQQLQQQRQHAAA